MKKPRNGSRNTKEKHTISVIHPARRRSTKIPLNTPVAQAGKQDIVAPVVAVTNKENANRVFAYSFYFIESKNAVLSA